MFPFNASANAFYAERHQGYTHVGQRAFRLILEMLPVLRRKDKLVHASRLITHIP